MPKHRWYRNWSRPAATSTRLNCSECSRTSAFRKTWMTNSGSASNRPSSRPKSISAFRCCRVARGHSAKASIFHCHQRCVYRERAGEREREGATGSTRFNFIHFQLEQSVQRFNHFYADVHSGRKLIWLYNMCKGEIVTNCFRNRYTLQVRSERVRSPSTWKQIKLIAFIYLSTVEHVSNGCAASVQWTNEFNRSAARREHRYAIERQSQRWFLFSDWT